MLPFNSVAVCCPLVVPQVSYSEKSMPLRLGALMHGTDIVAFTITHMRPCQEIAMEMKSWHG